MFFGKQGWCLGLEGVIAFLCTLSLIPGLGVVCRSLMFVCSIFCAEGFILQGSLHGFAIIISDLQLLT